MSVGLRIERRDFVEAALAIEGDRLGEGLVRLEVEGLDACGASVVLELDEEPAAEPEPASVGRDPHPFQLSRGAGMELEGTAADRPAVHPGDQEEAPRR